MGHEKDPLRQVRRSLAALAGAALLFGAVANATADDGRGAPASLAKPPQAPPRIASVEGGIEAAIDAPWRIEPDLGAPVLYPTIPIVFTVHDANLTGNDFNPVLGPFCELVIREEPPSGPAFPLVRRTPVFIDEVERSGPWLLNLQAENHRLCRPARGESCPDDLVIGTSAEWHATFLYAPRTQTPGADVRLTVQARVAREGQCGPSLPIVENASFDRLQLAPPPYLPLLNDYIIISRLSVHLGEAPLPRFESGDVYGDLHYHSQGTDNEGESAYAYRPTLQAMRALGLDFLFATDHASAGTDGQITDVDVVHIARIDIPGWVPWDEEIQDFIQSIPLHEEETSDAARDMNPVRFAALRKLLNDPPGASPTVPTGANAEVMTFYGRRSAPRIFLGAEVDVVPEMSASEAASGGIAFGNGVLYPWRSGCALAQRFMDTLNGILDIRLGTEVCTNTDDLAVPREGRYLVRDLQGFSDSFYARQHLVHLPTDGTRADAFIPSNTSFYGGATRRLGPVAPLPGDEDLLDSILYKEFEVGQKGYAFLAHPVDADSGDGVGRLGPDIIPFSELQLKDAFQSPYILGLQLWNEDTRLSSATEPQPSIPGFPLQAWDAGPSFTRFHWGRWLGPQPKGAYRDLYHGVAAWEKMLLWGILSSQTAGLRDSDGTPLEPGEPRRVFMAGGSDGHGDWNYRRQGRFFGVSGIVDTAIGKPRNLVHVGSERPETVQDLFGNTFGQVGQGQVTSTLASGNFSVTDGPALRIAIDRNNSGSIDPTDVPMGGFADFPSHGIDVPVRVEWKSSPEFGPVASIDLYVGVANDAENRGLVYASANHGVHSSVTMSGAVSPVPYLEANGTQRWELRDGYMLDPTATLTGSGKLRIVPLPHEGMEGGRNVYLRANDFVVGRRRVLEGGEPECHWNSHACSLPGHNNDPGCEEICTEPPSQYVFDRVSLPDRWYVRAFARTARKGGPLCANTTAELSAEERTAQMTGQCIERLAYTNPVWVDNGTVPPPPPDFSITCQPSPLTVEQGASASSTCTVTSLHGFTKPVSLSCLNVPAAASCAFSPAVVTPPANGAVSSTLTVSVAVTPTGTHPLRVKGFAPLFHTNEAALPLTVLPGRILTATFDAARQAPSCGDRLLGIACDSAALVVSRGAAGREPNSPNTIDATCVDGATPPASGRWTGVDRIRVYTTAGGLLTAGATARIEATVYASATPAQDAVDFYYAADAASPVWTKLATVVPTAAGAQTLSVPHRLPAGVLQAVRVQYRPQGTSSPACVQSPTADRDDLVFAVSDTP